MILSDTIRHFAVKTQDQCMFIYSELDRIAKIILHPQRMISCLEFLRTVCGSLQFGLPMCYWQYKHGTIV